MHIINTAHVGQINYLSIEFSHGLISHCKMINKSEKLKSSENSKTNFGFTT